MIPARGRLDIPNCLLQTGWEICDVDAPRHEQLFAEEHGITFPLEIRGGSDDLWRGCLNDLVVWEEEPDCAEV